MHKKIGAVILIFCLSMVLSGCLDSLPSLIVYDEIGMPEKSLGIYDVIPHKEINEDHEKIYDKALISYLNSKFTFTYITKSTDSDGKEVRGYYTGSFVPSKVANTSDLYVMAFPKMKIVGYNGEENTNESIDNALFFFKYEGGKILIWVDFIEDKLEGDASQDFKGLIADAYKYTLIRDPVFILTDQRKGTVKIQGEFFKHRDEIDRILALRNVNE